MTVSSAGKSKMADCRSGNTNQVIRQTNVCVMHGVVGATVVSTNHSRCTPKRDEGELALHLYFVREVLACVGNSCVSFTRKYSEGHIVKCDVASSSPSNFSLLS